MNKEQLLSLGLTEEQAAKVLEGFKGYVPSSRFNEVNEAKKNAEALLSERDKQLADFKKGAGDNEELKKQIEALQAENKAAKQKYDNDLQAFKISNAIDLALTSNRAKNLKAARALLDMDKIKLDGDTVMGLDDQIKALIKGDDTKFLFNTEQGQPNAPTGMKAGESTGKPGKPLEQMNYSERVQYLAAGGKL